MCFWCVKDCLCLSEAELRNDLPRKTMENRFFTLLSSMTSAKNAAFGTVTLNNLINIYFFSFIKWG